jgi:hypothetical protein
MRDETPLNPQLSGALTAVLAEARTVARGSVTAVRSPYRRVAIGRSWRVATGVRSRRGSLRPSCFTGVAGSAIAVQ